MAYVVIVINSSKESIDQLNAKVQLASKPHEAVNANASYLQAIVAGAIDASVQVTTRDSDPSVATSGTDSQQNTYNLS